MTTWQDIINKPGWSDLDLATKTEVRKQWLEEDVAPALANDPDRDAVLAELYNEPLDTGEGLIRSALGSAARGFFDPLAAAPEVAGAYLGIEGLEEFGGDVRGAIEGAFPVNPAEQGLVTDVAGVLGQVGQIVATGGGGSFVGGKLIGKGATELAKKQAEKFGARAAVQTAMGSSAVAGGLERAEQLGLEGGDRLLRGAIAGGTELLAERLGGFATELGGVGKAAGFADTVESGFMKPIIRGIGTEAGEEGLAEAAGQATDIAMAPEAAPGMDLKNIGYAMLLGGVGGAAFGGIEAAITPRTKKAFDGTTDFIPSSTPPPGMTVEEAEEQDLLKYGNAGEIIGYVLPVSDETIDTNVEPLVENVAATPEASATAAALQRIALGDTESGLTDAGMADATANLLTGIPMQKPLGGELVAEDAMLEGQPIEEDQAALEQQQPTETNVPLTQETLQQEQSRGQELQEPRELPILPAEQAAQAPEAAVGAEAAVDTQAALDTQGDGIVRDEGIVGADAELEQQKATLPVDGEGAMLQGGDVRQEETQQVSAAADVPTESLPAGQLTSGDVGVAGDPLVQDDDGFEMLKDMAKLRREQGRPDAAMESRIAAIEAARRGEKVEAGKTFSNVVVGHPQFDAPHPELSYLIPISITSKKDLDSKFEEVWRIRDIAQSYIGGYEFAQRQATTPTKKKAFAKKYSTSELNRQRDILGYINNDVIPELNRLNKIAPSVNATPPPQAQPQPATPATQETKPQAAASPTQPATKESTAAQPAAEETGDAGVRVPPLIQSMIETFARASVAWSQAKTAIRSQLDGSKEAVYLAMAEDDFKLSRSGNVVEIAIPEGGSDAFSLASLGNSLDGYFRFGDAKGVAKVRKKAGEPFKIIFNNEEDAADFTKYNGRTPAQVNEDFTRLYQQLSERPPEDAGVAISPSGETVQSSETPSALSKLQSYISTLSPKAQAAWTPERLSAAESYYATGNESALEPLTATQRKIVRREGVSESDAAAYEAEQKRQFALRNPPAATDSQFLEDYNAYVNSLSDETLQQERESREKAPDETPRYKKILRSADGNIRRTGVKSTPARAARNSYIGVIPGVENTWLGTVEEFDAEFPDGYPFDSKTTTPPADTEALVAEDGRAFIFTDRVQVLDGDSERAEQHGTSPGVEAIKRLLRHESFIHRGYMALPGPLKNRFADFVASGIIPPEDLDYLVSNGYPQHKGWRDNKTTEMLAAEEWLAQRVERMGRIPQSGPIASIMDWLRDVWRWLTGGETTDLDKLRNTMRAMHKALGALDPKQRIVMELPDMEMLRRSVAQTQQDQEYLAAVERGDSGSDNLIQLLRDAPESERKAVVDAWMQRNPVTAERLQRMVDEAAKKAGFTEKAYHGTSGDFTVFDSGLGGAVTGAKSARQAFFLTDDKSIAEQYARLAVDEMGGESERVISARIKGNLKQVDHGGKSYEDRQFSSEIAKAKEEGYDGVQFVNTDDSVFKELIGYEPLPEIKVDVDKNGNISLQRGNYKAYGEVLTNGYTRLTTPGGVAELVRSKDPDRVAAVFEDITNRAMSPKPLYKENRHTVYAVFNPNQIKSADPVTYDSNGAPIPPSQRFQSTSSDIRYSKVQRPPISAQVPALTTDIIGETSQENKLAMEAMRDGLEGLPLKYRKMADKGKVTDAFEKYAIDMVKPYTESREKMLELLEIMRDGKRISEVFDIDALKGQASLGYIFGEAALQAERMGDRVLADEFSYSFKGVGTAGGQALAVRRLFLESPRYQTLKAVAMIDSVAKEDQKAVVNAKVGKPTAAKVGAEFEGATEAARDTVADAIPSELQISEKVLELGAAVQGNPTLTERVKKLISNVIDRGRKIRALQKLKSQTRASIIPDGGDFENMSEAELEAEIARLTKEIEADMDFIEKEAAKTPRTQAPKTPVETAKAIINRVQKQAAGETTRVKPKLDRVRLLYKAHLRERMAEADFMDEAKAAGLTPQVAQELYDAAELEIAAILLSKEVRGKSENYDKLTRERLKHLDVDSSALVEYINRLRREGKLGPVNWRDIMQLPPTRQQVIKGTLLELVKQNPQLQNLSAEEQQTLADALEKVWERERERQFKLQVKRLEMPGAKQEDQEKVVSATPRIIKLINQGMLAEDAFYKAVGEQFGIKEMSDADRKRIMELSEIIQDDTIAKSDKAKETRELVTLLQKYHKLTTAEILSNVWVAHVLSGVRTQTDMALGFLNGLLNTVKKAGLVIYKNPNAKGAKTAAKGIQQFFVGLADGMAEAARYVRTEEPGLVRSDIEFINSYLEGGLRKGGLSTARKLRESDNKFLSALGSWLAILERVNTGWDVINYRATYQGTLAMAHALNPKIYKEALMPTAADFKAMEERAKTMLGANATRAQIKAKAFQDIEDGVHLLGKNLDESFMQEWKQMAAEFNYDAKEAAMMVDPTGIGGLFYRGIMGITEKAETAAKARADKAKEELLDPTLGRDQRFIRQVFPPLMYLLASQARNILGVRFIRFTGNKINELISYIPIAGMARIYLEEGMTRNNELTIKAMSVQMNQLIATAIMIPALIKAMLDLEEDDEERGYIIQGPWDNLTPERKSQLMADGFKPNTIAFYDKKTGRWTSYNYINWPSAGWFATAGSVSDYRRYTPEKWDEKTAAAKFMSGIYAGGSSFLDISSISQMTELFGRSTYSTDPATKGLEKVTKLATGYAGGFMPRIAKDVDSWFDKTVYKPEDTWGHIAKEMPFYRRSAGAPLRDIFYEPVQVSRSPWSRALQVSPDDPAYKALGRLNSRGIWLTPANPENRKVKRGGKLRDMTDEEANAYMAEVGKRYKEFVVKQGDRLLEMDVDRADELVSKYTARIREIAFKRAIATAGKAAIPSPE